MGDYLKIYIKKKAFRIGLYVHRGENEKCKRNG